MEGRLRKGSQGGGDGRSRRVEFSVPVLDACLGCHESRLQRNHAGSSDVLTTGERMSWAD